MGCLCGGGAHGVDSRSSYWWLERGDDDNTVHLYLERDNEARRIPLTRADLGRLIACLERCLPRVAGKPSAEEAKGMEKRDPTGRLERLERTVAALQHAVQRLEGPPKAGPGEEDEPASPPAPTSSAPNTWPMSPREVCRRYGMSACHCCERLACGDNTSPGAALYRAAKKCIGVPSGAALAAKADLIAAVGALENMA